MGAQRRRTRPPRAARARRATVGCSRTGRPRPGGRPVETRPSRPRRFARNPDDRPADGTGLRSHAPVTTANSNKPRKAAIRWFIVAGDAPRPRRMLTTVPVGQRRPRRDVVDLVGPRAPRAIRIRATPQALGPHQHPRPDRPLADPAPSAACGSGPPPACHTPRSPPRRKSSPPSATTPGPPRTGRRPRTELGGDT